jgi:AcrR family transcriptional regulator
MRTIPVVRWIANAAARLAGPHGAVAQEARNAGCSRQSVYTHARKVKAAVEAEHGGGPIRAELVEEVESLRQESTRLWDWLFQTIEFPLAKQQEFAVTAMAMGLSHSQIRALMLILQGAKASPSRSTIHRWVQAAGKAAGQVLEQLDRSCKVLVLVGCLDEIFFHRRPVLVGIEPHSMVWFLGKKAVDRQGSTWSEELQSWTSLRYVTSDGGTGLKAGIARIQRHRRDANQVVLETGLDVFHTKREAHQDLSNLWQRVERCWERAEAASRVLERARWQGRSLTGLTCPVRVAWEKASRAFQLYEKRETAWKRAEQALNVFRPDGSLNDRAWAQQQVAWALPRLPGSMWSKVRRLLQNKESFAFLDRLHRQLSQLSLPEALREGLVRLWWLRRQRPSKSTETAVGGYHHVAPLVQQILIEKMDPNWRESYRRVAALLGRTVRASSAVECMNSILRMHQSRHRTLTQGMLDLKRLYWNTRTFRGGQRKGHCPYEHLGIELPCYDFWRLLKESMDAGIAQTKTTGRPKAAPPGVTAS